MEFVKIKTFGKVNLGLDVTGRRDDGYHLVKMIMQTVDIFDIVTVSRWNTEQASGNDRLFGQGRVQMAPGDTGKHLVKVTCNHPGVPADGRNIAFKAAEKICMAYDITCPVHIDIQKNIPVEAGMAGGSADAAAVIRAMDQLFELRMDQAEQDRIAVSLGADVPFCLRKGTFLSEGIGEKLTRITDLAHCYMVIVKPDFSVSTAWAYHALDDYIEEQQKRGPVIHPDIDGLSEAISRRDIPAVCGKLGNILEQVVIPAHPEIQRIKTLLSESGALGTLMSGSGSTVFGIFADDIKAEKAFMNLGGGTKYDKFKVEF